jgi:hypothetical protein
MCLSFVTCFLSLCSLLISFCLLLVSPVSAPVSLPFVHLCSLYPRLSSSIPSLVSLCPFPVSTLLPLMLLRVLRISHTWFICVASTVNKNGSLPLHLACMKENASTEVVQALLAAHPAAGTKGWEESRTVVRGHWKEDNG